MGGVGLLLLKIAQDGCTVGCMVYSSRGLVQVSWGLVWGPRQAGKQLSEHPNQYIFPVVWRPQLAVFDDTVAFYSAERGNRVVKFKVFHSGPWLMASISAKSSVVHCICIFTFIQIAVLLIFHPAGTRYSLNGVQMQTKWDIKHKGRKEHRGFKRNIWGILFPFFFKCDKCRRNNPALSETRCRKHRWMMADKH